MTMSDEPLPLIEREHQAGVHAALNVRLAACKFCCADGPVPPRLTVPPPRAESLPVNPEPERGGTERLGDALERMLSRIVVDQPNAVTDPNIAEDGRPVCDTCGSKRWFRRDLRRDDPEFGKLIPCPACSADFALQARINRLWQDAPVKMRRYTLDGLAARSPTHAQFVGRLRRWIVEPGNPWLWCYGPWGCGKTGAVCGVAREVMASNKTVIFAVVPDMLDRIRRSFNASTEPNGLTQQTIMDDMLSCDLLVLDDMGKQSQTDWVAERLYQVLNDRYNNERRTALTSNDDPIALGQRLGMLAEVSRCLESAGPRWTINCDFLPNLRLQGMSSESDDPQEA